MALSLSAGALVHAADDFVLSRFSDYLDALRTQAGIPGLAAAIVGPDRRASGRARSASRTSNATSPTRLDTPFQLDGTTAGDRRRRWRSGARRTAGCRSTIRSASSTPASPDAGATIRQLLTHTSGGPDGLTFAYRPERLAPVAAAIAGCTDSTFRWGVSALLDQLAMVDSVPGSDVVAADGAGRRLHRVRAAALRGRAAPAGDAVRRRCARPRDAFVVRRVDADAGVGDDFDGARPRAVRSGAEEGSRHAARLARASRGRRRPTRNGQPLPHAYGWFVQTYNGEPIVWQFGVSDNASSSMIISVPRRGLTLILLANSSGLARPFDAVGGRRHRVAVRAAVPVDFRAMMQLGPRRGARWCSRPVFC